MTAFSIKHFDTLEFVKKSKEYGINEQFAEYTARQIEQAIDIAVVTAREEMQTRELATKTDIKQLEVKIEQYRYDSLKFIIWTGIGVVITLGGMIAKGFHWV
jgi:uncharacterized protein YgbK (DUF1537 family)